MAHAIDTNKSKNDEKKMKNAKWREKQKQHEQ